MILGFLSLTNVVNYIKCFSNLIQLYTSRMNSSIMMYLYAVLICQYLIQMFVCISVDERHWFAFYFSVMSVSDCDVQAMLVSLHEWRCAPFFSDLCVSCIASFKDDWLYSSVKSNCPGIFSVAVLFCFVLPCFVLC